MVLLHKHSPPELVSAAALQLCGTGIWLEHRGHSHPAEQHPGLGWEDGRLGLVTTAGDRKLPGSAGRCWPSAGASAGLLGGTAAWLSTVVSAGQLGGAASRPDLGSEGLPGEQKCVVVFRSALEFTGGRDSAIRPVYPGSGCLGPIA